MPTLKRRSVITFHWSNAFIYKGSYVDVDIAIELEFNHVAEQSMQFNQVLSAVPPDTDVILIGDFNIEKEEESLIAMPRGYLDAWRVCQKEHSP